MTTATTHHPSAATDAPFEAVRRRLLGTDGTITSAGNIGYTFGGGAMGVLATRFGMAAGGPALRPSIHHRPSSAAVRTARADARTTAPHR